MTTRVLACAIALLVGACALPDIVIITDDTGVDDTVEPDIVDESVSDVVDIVPAMDVVDTVVAPDVIDVIDAADVVVDVGPPDDGFDPCSVGACGPAVSISVRLHHSCVVRAMGAVECWGDGQLGDGIDHGATSTPTPVIVQGLPAGDPAVRVAAGSSFTCARLTSGNVYCWGANGQGQLGNPSAGASSLVAVRVQGLPAGGALDIAAGDDYVCVPVSTAALNSVYCWGTSVVTGAIQTQATPLMGTGCTSTSITGGANHGCANFCSGSIYCWGSNRYDESSGMASDGGVSVPISLPTLPTALGTAHLVSAGSDDTYVLNAAGVLWGWGLQSVDQLGILVNSTYPSASAHQFTGTYSTVSAGDDFACAITTGASPNVVCWGSDASGQLGDGATSAGMALGPSLLASLSPQQVSAGTHHACAIAAPGAVYCWGSNTYGESGAGPGIDPATPTHVVLP